MNKKQEDRLKAASAMLTRADQEKNLQTMAAAHKEIKEIVTEIYKNKIDVPTVLGVEKILNQGQTNVLGKAPKAYKQLEMLDRQANTGLEMHNLFSQAPEVYVSMAYATRKDVQKGKPLRNGIPYDPVRSALTEHREQLTTGLALVTGNPFQDSLDTNKMRFHATVTAERDYLEKFLKHHDKETPEKKQEHLQDLDRKIARLTRQVEPPQQEKQQEQQQEPPKQAEKQPKRSKGLSR